MQIAVTLLILKSKKIIIGKAAWKWTLEAESQGGRARTLLAYMHRRPVQPASRESRDGYKWEGPYPRGAEGKDSHPQPCSQVTGRFGLCSQSLRWDMRLSSRTIALQPNTALSQAICSFDNMFRMIRGTGRRWATVTTLRSTGHVCCWENHWVMQALQKACSQWGA